MLVGCGGDDGGTQRPISRTFNATLAALPGGGTLSGTANMKWTDDQGMFTSAITISSDVPGMSRPWHVHLGTCAAGGAILGSEGGYAPLAVGQDGTAMTTATIEVEPDATMAYHVNVHESQAALANVIACGNLSPGTGNGSNGGGYDAPY